jgi:hypothetical protein
MVSVNRGRLFVNLSRIWGGLGGALSGHVVEELKSNSGHFFFGNDHKPRIVRSFRRNLCSSVIF